MLAGDRCVLEQIGRTVGHTFVEGELRPVDAREDTRCEHPLESGALREAFVRPVGELPAGDGIESEDTQTPARPFLDFTERPRRG